MGEGNEAFKAQKRQPSAICDSFPEKPATKGCRNIREFAQNTTGFRNFSKKGGTREWHKDKPPR